MIQVLMTAATKVAMNVIMSMASEKFIEWLILYVDEHIVKTTKTKHDDKFYAEVMKAYKKGKVNKGYKAPIS